MSNLCISTLSYLYKQKLYLFQNSFQGQNALAYFFGSLMAKKESYMKQAGQTIKVLQAITLSGRINHGK